MIKPKVLLIGYSKDLGNHLPSMFSRAGFDVEIMTTESLLVKIGKKFEVKSFGSDRDLLAQLQEVDETKYALIVPFDDCILRAIKNLNIALERKIKMLPIVDEKGLEHIGSKIGLSQVLQKNNIKTPPFAIVNDDNEAEKAVQNLGFPLLIKIDCSGGGTGVYECQNFAEVRSNLQKIAQRPLLFQKKISGRELDLSGFFQNGELVYFACSLMQSTISKQGPSFLRTYFPRKSHDSKMLGQMKSLGAALRADGFANITAIETANQEIYFFEADMRPNVWVDRTKFFDEDPAQIIKRFFARDVSQNFVKESLPEEVVISYFLRIPSWQVLCNKYWIWRHMSLEDWQIFFRFREDQFSQFARFIKRLPTLTIRIFLPDKNHRKELKRKLKSFLVWEMS